MRKTQIMYIVIISLVAFSLSCAREQDELGKPDGKEDVAINENVYPTKEGVKKMIDDIFRKYAVGDDVFLYGGTPTKIRRYEHHDVISIKPSDDNLIVTGQVTFYDGEGDIITEDYSSIFEPALDSYTIVKLSIKDSQIFPK